MTTTPFEHSPLNADDPKAIQILELLPSRNLKGPICCELRHTSLGENVEYEALSYAWGEPEPGHTVFINGPHTLDVTRNCLEALTCLRRRFHRRSLWVDAICIDQREDDRSKRERDRQINIMGDVYRKAKKVLVWLGPSEPTTARTMAKLKCLAMVNAAGQSRHLRDSALRAIEDYLSKRMGEQAAFSSRYVKL